MAENRKSPVQVFGRILWGIYNILSTYLLGWILVLATLALGFHFLTEVIVAQFGFERADQWWAYVEWKLGVDAIALRLPLYVGLQAGTLYAGRSLLDKKWDALEHLFDTIAGWLRARTVDRPRLYAAIRVVFTVGVTVVLVPFVFQPTLVGGGMSTSAWLARTANLADGTASRNVVDSVAGMYRRLVVDDVASQGGVDAEDLEPVESFGTDATEDGPDASDSQPLMDRWDPVIHQATDGDPRDFAYVKAFMQIESSGRQFAVSPTGCSGLMQFCSGTAQRQPFRRIFGAGAVYPCNCSSSCRIPRRISRALETGNRDEIDDLEDEFPCELSDARFDGEKSIRAGARYIERLSGDYDDNLFLMYIGYNSGPGVADAVWSELGRDADADLEDIAPHLPDAMRPHFHGAADRRARSLLETHLPRLERHFQAYHHQTQVAMESQTSAVHSHVP